MQEYPHPAAMAPECLLRVCDELRTRRSGPGGQHRNKVETAVVLTHRESGITAEAGERRSQSENRAVALFRLRTNLALTVRGTNGIASSPSELWKSRVRGQRIMVNPEHDDFPALLAEALDVLAAHDWNIAPAAVALSISTTQLTRFLKCESRARLQLNTRRGERGLKPLH